MLRVLKIWIFGEEQRQKGANYINICIVINIGIFIYIEAYIHLFLKIGCISGILCPSWRISLRGTAFESLILLVNLLNHLTFT